jgi:hypothetical protein
MSTLENCNFRTPNIMLCSLHLAAAGPSPWPRQAPAATGNSPWPSQNLAAGPGPCCLDAAGTGLCTRQHLAAGGLGPWPRQAPVAAGNGPCSLDAVGIDPCSLVRPDAAVQVGARVRVQAADDEPGGRWRQPRRPLRPRPGRQHGNAAAEAGASSMLSAIGSSICGSNQVLVQRAVSAPGRASGAARGCGGGGGVCSDSALPSTMGGANANASGRGNEAMAASSSRRSNYCFGTTTSNRSSKRKRLDTEDSMSPSEVSSFLALLSEQFPVDPTNRDETIRPGEKKMTKGKKVNSHPK